MVVPQKIDGFQWKILIKWMIWGYPHAGKPLCDFMGTPGKYDSLDQSTPQCITSDDLNV